MTTLGLRAATGWAVSSWRDSMDLRGAEPRDVSYELDHVRHDAAIYGPGTPRPGVLLLHTALGLTRHERAIARRLERSGFTAMTVQYSRRTSGDVTQDDEACRRIERICRTAFEQLQADRAVEGGKVAVLGLSLGGYFAIRLASSHPSPSSVVVWYGVYPSLLPLPRWFSAMSPYEVGNHRFQATRRAPKLWATTFGSVGWISGSHSGNWLSSSAWTSRP